MRVFQEEILKEEGYFIFEIKNLAALFFMDSNMISNMPLLPASYCTESPTERLFRMVDPPIVETFTSTIELPEMTPLFEIKRDLSAVNPVSYSATSTCSVSAAIFGGPSSISPDFSMDLFGMKSNRFMFCGQGR